MNAGSVRDETNVIGRDHRGAIGRGNRLADADDRGQPCLSRASDDVGAIRIERGISEVRVTVDHEGVDAKRRPGSSPGRRLSLVIA